MADSSRPNWARRCERLFQAAADREIDTLVVSNPVNVRYLSGFAGSSGWLLVRPGEARLLTDGRYVNAVRASLAAGALGPVTLDIVERGYDEALATVMAALGARRAGFEAATVTVSGLEEWQRRMPAVDWQPTKALVEAQRVIKDDVELRTIRDGALRLAAVASDLRSVVAAGRTEREVARAIEAALDRAGFERPAFETIVASGPNSAFPHARPTDRRLDNGDLVVLDFGGVLDGYCVDLTRMAAVGHIDARARSLFEAVREAQRAALAAARPGATGADVDRAARGRLEEAGLGPAFSHGTGHGLGLEVHEAPRISRADSGHVTTLTPGMVFTIEPGAYVEGVGGVRLEDDVLVTAEGCEVLTECTRDLLVV
jgi:Xaa-Pro aminopeptidase